MNPLHAHLELEANVNPLHAHLPGGIELADLLNGEHHIVEVKPSVEASLCALLLG